MNRKLAHGIGAAFVMALLAAVLSVGASASETMQKVMYLDENGVEKTTTATVVESLPDDAEDQNVTWTDGWYVVADDVTIPGDVTVEGNVNLILSPQSYLGIEGSVFDGSVDGQQGHLNIYAQHISDENAYHGWEASAIGHLELTGNEESSCIYVNTGLYGGCIDGKISAASLHVHHGFLNANRPFSSIYPGTFAISGGYAAVNLECSKATISDGTFQGKISSGEVEITGGTINSSEHEPYVIESSGVTSVSGGEVNGHVHSVGNIEINSENGNPEINGHVESDGDITISDGQVNGSVNANGYNYNSGTVTITGGTVTDVNGVMVDVTDATLGSAYASEILNIQGDTVIDGVVSAEGTVNMYSGTIGGVYMLASDMGSSTVNITGGTVTGDVNGFVIYVGDQDGKTEPVIRGSIPNTRGSSEHSVTVYSGTIEGDIDTSFFTMEGGKVQGNVQVGGFGGWMDAGTCASLTLQHS